MALALSPPGWSRAPLPGGAAEAMAPARLAASRLAPGPRVSAVAAAAARSAAPLRLPLKPSVKYRFFSCCLRKWTLRSLPAAHGFYPGDPAATKLLPNYGTHAATLAKPTGRVTLN